MDLKEAYKVMQAAWVKENNIEVGDKVKCLRPFNAHELGCHSISSDSTNCPRKGEFVKDEAVGAIRQINTEYLWIDCGTKYGGHWNFPFFVLELVEKAKKPEKMVTVKGREYSEDTLQKMIQQYSE